MAERGWNEGERPRPAGSEESHPGGDAILGAALEGLRRAAEEVEVERSTAETLQRSLLRERLPDVSGLRLAARYLPGSGEVRIGGDWYDAIPLRDGRVALVIGDVVGRGIEAAARMAHLQSAVRAYALEGLRPSLILERMNGFVQELEGRGTATLLLAVVDPEAETVRLATAAHPPPLIVDPDGNSSFAVGPSGNPLGASLFPSYEETVLAMPTSLVGVRRGLGRWLRAIGVGDADAYELQVACGEACANAIAHAYPPGDAHFAVRASREEDELLIEVGDFGAWRPPRGGSGGRGLALIEQLTDSLEIDRGIAGTTVRMRRRMEGMRT
jgi:anti-sigma regulatory factor (Ser/Thr protein kinase)